MSALPYVRGFLEVSIVSEMLGTRKLLHMQNKLKCAEINEMLSQWPFRTVLNHMHLARLKMGGNFAAHRECLYNFPLCSKPIWL